MNTSNFLQICSLTVDSDTYLQTFDSLSLRVHLALITSFTVFSIRGRCNHDPISSFQEIQWSGVLCLALRDSSSGSRSFSGSDVLSSRVFGARCCPNNETLQGRRGYKLRDRSIMTS